MCKVLGVYMNNLQIHFTKLNMIIQQYVLYTVIQIKTILMFNDRMYQFLYEVPERPVGIDQILKKI